MATTRRGPAASLPVEVAGRVGLAARGCVYLVVATLAVTVARQGDAEHEADTVGALAAVGDRPYGRILLWLLAAGLTGYALWRAVQAVTGRTTGREEPGGLVRLGAALRSVAYLGLAATAAQAAMHGANASASEQQESWTATVLGWPRGPTIVAVAGGLLILLGAAEVLNGISGRFMQRLREGRLGEVRHGLVRLAGGVGHTGRGAAYVLVGAFIVQAALRHDPSKSRGLDGALAELAARPYGPAALLALALGLLAFGLYSVAEARWRRIRA